MASMCLVRGATPAAETVWPRNSTVDLPNSHLAGMIQPKVTKAIKDLAEMIHVLLHVSAGHQDVVEVDEAETQVGPHPVHEELESVSSIPEAKGHHNKLPEAEGSHNGSLGNVHRVHHDLIIPFHQVNLGKNRLTTKPLGKILNVGNRSGHSVESSVVANSHQALGPYGGEKPKRRSSVK